MKIIHIIPSLQKGGAERLVLDICNELSIRPNIDVIIITFNNKNDYDFLCHNVNIKIISAKITPSILHKSIVDISELHSFINAFNPDIIHSHLFESEFISRWNTSQNITYFTHCHDNMIQFKNLSVKTFFSKKLFTAFYEKQIMINRYKKIKNIFIAISTDTLKYFKHTLPKTLNNNCFLLHNSIQFDRFESNKIRCINKNKPLRLISTGSFVPKKNQMFLVNVVSSLVKKGISVQLTLLGDGKDFEKIKTHVSEHALSEFICMPGNVNNVEDYLSNSDIYVHSATYEPFGLALLEAMASGLPVVCLDGLGNRDILINGENGYIISNNDKNQFIEKLLKLYDDNELYTRLSSNAKQFAKHFDIKMYVDKLIEIYTQNIKRNATPNDTNG